MGSVTLFCPPPSASERALVRGPFRLRLAQTFQSPEQIYSADRSFSTPLLTIGSKANCAYARAERYILVRRSVGRKKTGISDAGLRHRSVSGRREAAALWAAACRSRLRSFTSTITAGSCPFAFRFEEGAPIKRSVCGRLRRDCLALLVPHVFPLLLRTIAFKISARFCQVPHCQRARITGQLRRDGNN